MEMERLIQNGEVLYTPEGIKRFTKTPQNLLMVEAIKTFLQGHKLFDKDLMLEQAYRHHLLTNPRARAAAMVARQLLTEGPSPPLSPILRRLLSE